MLEEDMPNPDRRLDHRILFAITYYKEAYISPHKAKTVKIPKFELHKNTKVFTIYFSLAVVSWSLLYPALNWPDEAYKINQIGVDSNFYIRLLSYLYPDDCNIAYSHDTTKGYLSNSFVIELLVGQKCYYMLKAFNAVIIVVLSLICLLLSKDRWRQEIIMLSLIWPSSLFYVTGINQHVLFHVISTLIVSMTINRSFLWGYFALAIVLVSLDRSFVSLVVFLGFLSILKMQNKYTIILTALLFVVSEVARPYIGASSAFIDDGKSIAEISEAVSRYEDSWIISFGLFFVSFVYLGGTSSVYGFIVEYAFVLVALAILIFSNRKDSGMRVYISALLLTYIFVVSYVPTLQTFRYYAYIMPAIVFYLLRSKRQKTYYSTYCVFFSAAYILQTIV